MDKTTLKAAQDPLKQPIKTAPAPPPSNAATPESEAITKKV